MSVTGTEHHSFARPPGTCQQHNVSVPYDSTPPLRKDDKPIHTIITQAPLKSLSWSTRLAVVSRPYLLGTMWTSSNRYSDTPQKSILSRRVTMEPKLMMRCILGHRFNAAASPRRPDGFARPRPRPTSEQPRSIHCLRRTSTRSLWLCPLLLCPQEQRSNQEDSEGPCHHSKLNKLEARNAALQVDGAQQRGVYGQKVLNKEQIDNRAACCFTLSTGSCDSKIQTNRFLVISYLLKLRNCQTCQQSNR